MDDYKIVEADLALDSHQHDITFLVDAYAQDPMGGGRPLPEDVRHALLPGLRAHPTTVILLAYQGTEPAGIAVCFLGFSTFAARPLLNIHDLAVLPAHRGKGLGRQLLRAVEYKARDLGCCRLTLEVLYENQRARRVYTQAGFGPDTQQTAKGETLFLTKPLAHRSR